MAKKPKAKKPKGKPGRPPKLGDARSKERFLTVLRQCGGIRAAACRRFRISVHTLIDEEKRSPEFKEATNSILAESLEDLEAEGYRRAMNGSDTLLKFFLAALRPEKYSQRYQLEHLGEVQVNHDHEHRITVVEDAHWYNNDAHDKAAEAIAASSAGVIESVPIQGDRLRAPVGQNGNGASHGD